MSSDTRRFICALISWSIFYTVVFYAIGYLVLSFIGSL